MALGSAGHEKQGGPKFDKARVWAGSQGSSRNRVGGKDGVGAGELWWILMQSSSPVKSLLPWEEDPVLGQGNAEGSWVKPPNGMKFQGGSLAGPHSIFFILTAGSHSCEQRISLHNTSLNRILINEFTSVYFLFMCIKQSLLINYILSLNPVTQLDAKYIRMCLYRNTSSPPVPTPAAHIHIHACRVREKMSPIHWGRIWKCGAIQTYTLNLNLWKWK